MIAIVVAFDVCPEKLAKEPTWRDELADIEKQLAELKA